jgi:hypothetical protein
LEVPINNLKIKLTRLGFIKNQKSIPKLIWTSYTKDQIIYLYQSWYRDIILYYRLVKNKVLTSYLHKVLNSSCATFSL